VRVWVELSGENPALARAEAVAAALAEGLDLSDEQTPTVPGCALVPFEADDVRNARRLGHRLALARRILAPWPERGEEDVAKRLERQGGRGESAAFRWLTSPGGNGGPAVRRLAAAYRAGGGRIRLQSPDRTYWLLGGRPAELQLCESVGEVDRRSYGARRMPALPFQRPVSLPPRRARAATNLAGVRTGDRVVDPFLGTGALLLEAALLGARVYGVDVNPDMVRGALRNFAHFGLHPERLEVADASEAAQRFPEGFVDAVVTDPPYGRSSGTGGEPPLRLLARVLPVWGDRVRPGGRIVVVGPGEAEPLPPPWSCGVKVEDRVHRSLTRVFRVFERRPESPADAEPDPAMTSAGSARAVP
jgi:tRNA (guanine10-N2)-dimethyltransferase